MALDVIGYPEITELTTLELSSLVITPASVVDVQVNQQDEVQVVITEVVNDITVADGIVVSIPSLDDVPDGVQYAKVVAEVLEEGKVILAEAIGTLDDIRNGTNYAKILASATVDGLITLEEVVGTLDDIAEGVTYGKIKLSALQPGTGFVLTDYLINGTYAVLKAAALDVNGFVVMDNIIDGTYARVKASGLTAEGLVVLDEVVDGTYSKVLTTSVLAGLIKITSLVSDAGDAANLDDLPDGVSYSRVASTSIEAGKIKLDEGIVDGTTYARVRSTVLEAGKILLAETVTTGGGKATIDNLADGSTFKRIKAVALDVNGLVVASQIQDAGGYTSKILATNVSAGRILLTASDNSGFNANYVAEVSGKYWSPLSDSPAGTGLFITTEYIGFYSAGTWTVRIQNDGGVGKFYVGSGANNYINWNGSTLTIRGSLTLADVSGAGALAAVDSVAYGDITGTKPPANADVTLSAISGGLSLTGGGLVLASGGAAIRGGQTAYNTGAGFWLGDVSGTTKFSLGSPAGNYLTWDGATLTLKGALSAATGTFSGALSAATGTFSGTITSGGTFTGALSAATGTFAGTLSAATGSFSGTVTTSNITATGGSVGTWAIGATYLQSASSGQRIVFTAGATPTIKAYNASGNYMQIAANMINWYEGTTKYIEITGRGLYFYALNYNTMWTDGTFYFNTSSNVAIEIAYAKALTFGISTNYIIKDSAPAPLRYGANDSHRFYISGTEKFWVHKAGVGVVNTSFSITTGNKFYLDSYDGSMYIQAMSSPSGAIKLQSTYLIVAASNLTGSTGSFAINGAYLYWYYGGTSYKVQGTAI